MEKALEQYRNRIVSLDKAAEIAGINLNEMMQHAVANGIKSEETVEEFRGRLKVLMKRWN